MKEKIESDLFLKIISVVFAFLLWVFVINIDNPIVNKTFSDVPVNMLNEQVLDELNQTYKINEGETVSFTVRGKKSVVDRLRKNDFRATADVSSMSDVHAIVVKVEALRYKEQLDIDTNGATVQVALEDLKSNQIPVVINVTGKPAEGYAVSNKTATPNLISVSGPKSVISQIDHVGVNVSVSGAKKDVTMTKDVICYDESGDELSKDQIRLDTKKIKVEIELSRTKNVPVTVNTTGTPATDYVLGTVDYNPKSIQVTGSEEDLELLDEIELDTLDISGSTKTIEKTIKASELKLPDGISLVQTDEEIGNIVVKVNIEKRAKKTISLRTSQITLLNNTENYKVTFEDETISVKVSGLESVINKLEAKDLNPKMDLESYEPGTHTVQVQLTALKNMTIEDNVSAKITVEN